MKIDIKLVSVLIIIVHLAHVESWGPRIRIRVPVFRQVARVVRKAGNGIKTGVRKTGEGLKTAAEKTGEGLKKAGEGLKKAGEVTGKHLYKGLKETGKALITASSFVGDILDRINLMKFIWKKLGACCIPIPSLCRAKRRFNSVKRSLKHYNKVIDQRWTKVEIVFQWIDKINENIEDIAYHVDRITSGSEETITPISPPLIIQYNTKMNLLKQDVKWKNSSVIHLTRQGVTTFVDIEMAWQCPKVASSVKSGLKTLQEAQRKCVTILRESNNFLRFLNQGWNQMKTKLSSTKLRTRLNEVKALCLDSHHSYCVTVIGNFLSKISRSNYGKTFELQEDLITALAAMKYTYSCLQRKNQVLATVSEYCQKGNENFHSVFLQAVVDFFPNSDLCTGLVTKDYTTKENVLKLLRVKANKDGFYSSCSLNTREVITKTCLNYSTSVKNYALPPHEKARLFADCKKIVPSLGTLKCQPGLCKNGGTCLEQANSYTCDCAKGFKGIKCEFATASTLPYETIGCYQDHGSRAIPTIEGQDNSLDGSYKGRQNAIEKCYQAAKKRGFQIFALQDGGWCATGASTAKSFNKYGKSGACKADGKGGPWANQVYYIKDYNGVGCYKDTGNRAIQPLEGKDPVLDGHYRSRKYPIMKCAVAARRAGFTMFGIQHGGWCASSASAQNSFNRYGKSSDCKSDGEGGPWANEVYILKASTLPYEAIGCYQDHGSRAIPTIEGQDNSLDGSYKGRQNAIEKCYQAAKKKGFKVFGIQDGGWCASSGGAAKTFNKYGKSGSCKADGKGGPWANEVYYIKDYSDVGCYKDSGVRAIQPLEGKDPILDGPYRSRKYAIAKCAVAARRAGFTMFGIQHGGWCASSASAKRTFHKYGKSFACKHDGKGGPWANEVYILK